MGLVTPVALEQMKSGEEGVRLAPGLANLLHDPRMGAGLGDRPRRARGLSGLRPVKLVVLKTCRKM